MSKVFRGVLFTLAFGATLFAQEKKFEIGASVTGNFLRTVNGFDTDHSVKNSLGVGANFRTYFSKRHGLDISWSYSNPAHTYFSPSVGSTPAVGVTHKTWTNEATTSYVFKLRSSESRIQPFLLAGGGALLFTPNGLHSTVGSVGTTAKLTGVYGGGIDAYLSSRIGLRAQYKGFVYNDPANAVIHRSTQKLGHMAQPSLGLFWRF
ncbi:outer membrane beta-barrel protein [Bryobacter aggregatus]|uniref:outer membrane beta-barrel protein n=1 Tax=Bryobacter aggregatus TaxID=360054 RepID=UPI0004E13CE6|nr:outer membrane beta-barrel protein [Bryobacter aggregatus]